MCVSLVLGLVLLGLSVTVLDGGWSAAAWMIGGFMAAAAVVDAVRQRRGR